MAWRDAPNADIACLDHRFIRQAALSDPLERYDDRVARAMGRILASRPWTTPQLQVAGSASAGSWVNEIVVDRAALDSGEFQAGHGGFNRINRMFDGRLQAIRAEINEALWRETG
jgi:type I restriction enzyme R subunit